MGTLPVTITDDAMAALLTCTRTIAVVGASPKPHRAAHGVMRFLQSQGYRCIPVNPAIAGQQLLGELVYPDLASVPEPIDLVDVFRNSADAGAVMDEAIGVQAKAVWLQLGVINEDGATRARTAGLTVVMDRCPAIEIPRLIVLGLFRPR
jgi:uncharacterized protein